MYSVRMRNRDAISMEPAHAAAREPPCVAPPLNSSVFLELPVAWPPVPPRTFRLNEEADKQQLQLAPAAPPTPPLGLPPSPGGQHCPPPNGSRPEFRLWSRRRTPSLGMTVKHRLELWSASCCFMETATHTSNTASEIHALCHRHLLSASTWSSAFNTLLAKLWTMQTTLMTS